MNYEKNMHMTGEKFNKAELKFNLLDVKGLLLPSV